MHSNIQYSPDSNQNTRSDVTARCCQPRLEPTPAPAAGSALSQTRSGRYLTDNDDMRQEVQERRGRCTYSP
ncbi:hypothetical protein Y032_0282g1272 [Ancylostoma ceylanicum]|uniref:Uncharacterized protein n=1 Tax=Ancylostoma ceylanicum TaxID=53326 RepID=A0A016S6F6_9BILA|nr:hypothetical protein Y032_0282g1272 [Ancylostoma ceylanicum]